MTKVSAATSPEQELCMPDGTIQRYRLTIGTCQSGTIFTIGASKDDEAIHKATRIARSLEPAGGEFHLERANGSTVSRIGLAAVLAGE